MFQMNYQSQKKDIKKLIKKNKLKKDNSVTQTHQHQTGQSKTKHQEMQQGDSVGKSSSLDTTLSSLSR